MHLKCYCIAGSIRNGLREPILSSLDKRSGFKTIHEPETIQYEKMNVFVLNTIFHLDDDDRNKVEFNGATKIFTF